MGGWQNDGDDTTIKGGTDGTTIGNVGDRLKVDPGIINVAVTSANFASIFKKAEFSIISKNETDITGTAYTVTSGKTFVLTHISGSYDTQSPLFIRLKKQTGGSGPFNTEYRLSLKQHGQDASFVGEDFSFGIIIANAGDVLKLTYESALSKGSAWAAFAGVEY